MADIVARRPSTQVQSLLDGHLADLRRDTLDLAAAYASRIVAPHSAILPFQIQGALGEHTADHSPAGNRDAAYVLNIAGSWERPDDDAANMQWARDCFEAMCPCSTGGTYVNFLTEEDGADRIQAAYGPANLKRLPALKRQYDPDDFFRHTKRVS